MLPQDPNKTSEASTAEPKRRKTVIETITSTLGNAIAGVGYLLPGQIDDSKKAPEAAEKIIDLDESEPQWTLGDPVESPHDIARAFDSADDYRRHNEWDMAYDTYEQIVRYLDDNVIKPGSAKGMDTYRRARLAQWHTTSDAYEAAEKTSNSYEMKRWAEKGEAAGYRASWGWA